MQELQGAGIGSYKIERRILDGEIQVYDEYMKPGIPLNAAIGQGDDRFTPLQMANYIATIANNGTRYRPHLVKQIIKPDSTVVENVKPEVMAKLNIKQSTFSAIKAGMGQVVDEGGTASAAFKGFPIKTAAKTGTAQASGGMADYSWFSGFAPADNPQIAIAVVIYEGGSGSANVARDIYEQYFGLNKNK
jgi:penicillin-binding protein 2